MCIFLLADLGITGLNIWASANKRDWIWFGFSLLSIILLFVSGVIFVGGII